MTEENDSVTCEICEHPITSNARFCRHCGAPVQFVEVSAAQKKGLVTALIIFYALEFFICALYRFNDSLQGFTTLVVIDSIMAAMAISFFAFAWKDVKTVLQWKSFSIKKCLSYASTAIIFSIVVQYSVSWLNKSLFDSDSYYYYAFIDSEYPVFFMLLFTAVTPALFEELAYRGFVLGALLTLLDKKQAIFISAFVFALIHLSMLSFFWLLPFALYLGYVRTKENTMWYGVIIHFCFNAVNCVFEIYNLGLF